MSVDTWTQSKHDVGQWPKQVKQNGQCKWKNGTNASARIRRSKWSRPRAAKTQAKSKTPEIQGRRLPKDASVNKDHPKYTRSSWLYQTTWAIINHFESKSSMEQPTSKWGMTVSKMCPTDKPKPTWRQSTKTQTEKLTKKCIEKSTSQVLLTSQSTPRGILPRHRPTSWPSQPTFCWSRHSRDMKSTGWSPKRTSKDDYLVKPHLWVNVTTGCKTYSSEHADAPHGA